MKEAIKWYDKIEKERELIAAICHECLDEDNDYDKDELRSKMRDIVKLIYGDMVLDE
jgi:hypothetical protein